MFGDSVSDGVGFQRAAAQIIAVQIHQLWYKSGKLRQEEGNCFSTRESKGMMTESG
jgi:hypothetical protein